MKYLIYILLFGIIAQSACVNKRTSVQDIDKQSKSENGNLEVRIIEIPIYGRVIEVTGNAYYKKMSTGNYCKVELHDDISEYEILNLDKGAIVRIGFKENKTMTIRSFKGNSWFIFKLKDNKESSDINAVTGVSQLAFPLFWRAKAPRR